MIPSVYKVTNLPIRHKVLLRNDSVCERYVLKHGAMKTLISFLSIFLFTLGAIAQQGSISEQLRDFRVFEKVLQEKEGRLDLHANPDSMNDYLNQLERALSNEKSLVEQYKLYSKTLAKIQCGHTQIHPTKHVLKEWLAARNSLPFDYYLQGKKLFVNKLQSSDYPLVYQGKSSREQRKKIKERSEIISIDGRTVEQMMQDISPFLSSDENALDFKYFQAGQLFEFYRHLSRPFTTDSVAVVFTRGRDTSEIYFQLGTAPVHTMNTRLKKAGDDFDKDLKNMGEFSIVRGKYAYFRFPSFKAGHGKKYETFLETSFKNIKRREIKRVIVDLRGNTGGVMQYSLMRYFVGEDVVLGRYVVEKPKKGFEDKHIKKMDPDYIKHRRMSRIQKRTIRKGKFNNGEVKTGEIDKDLVFDGEVVVITDEGTFSSAAMLACHLKTLANAKIVGRPAGGSFYRGNAGTLTVELPKSEFRLFVNPNTFYSHLPDAADPVEVKKPDVLLTPGYLKPRKIDDYYLKAALREF